MNQREMSLSDVGREVIENVPDKIYMVLSNGWGVILSTFLFICSFLGNRTPLLAYIGVAVLFDAIWGVVTAVKADRFILSKLLSKSAIKIAAYCSVYALVALVEKGFDGEFMVSSSIVAAILISSELWSILGHIGLAYPDFLVVKILKKYLKGEMAKKLGIPESELDELLTKRTVEASIKKTNKSIRKVEEGIIETNKNIEDLKEYESEQ